MKNRLAPVLILLIITFSAAAVYAEPAISAAAAVVIDAETGIVLFEHNKDEKNYPASTTKIMTALLAIENSGGNYSSRVNFSHNAVFSIEPGSSNIAMNEGESLSLDDALYGLLLASANEVANALAEDVSGTVENFAEKMNARAAEAGAVNTHFTNPHGLPDEEHYTTAYDMALIMREAVKQPKFVEVISTQRHDIMPTELQPEVRVLNNTHRMIWPHTSYYNEWVVGGKTGFTDDAQHTLVTYARKGDISLITAVMHAETWAHYTDTAALLEYGFEQFADVEIFAPDGYEAEVPVMQRLDEGVVQVGTAVAKADRSVTRYLPKQAAQYIATEAKLPESVTAPVAAGDRLGELRIYCNGTLQATIPLAAAEPVSTLNVIPSRQPEQSGQSDQQESTYSTDRDRIAIGAAAVAALSAVLVLVSLKLLSNLRGSRR